MGEDKQEIRKLRRLLKQRLSFSERIEIERRLRELEIGKDSEPTTGQSVSPFLLGVWDKPAPQPESADPEPTPKPKKPEVPKCDEPSSSTDIVEQEISPEEAEAIAESIVALAERMAELRSYWARTLSPEIEQQAEVALARLQELAREIPKDLAEVALGRKASLLNQEVRELKKPRITEEAQLNLFPPSAPSLDASGKWADLYYALTQPRQPHNTEHAPGYVPDGLQAFV